MSEKKKESKQEADSKVLAKTGTFLDGMGFLMIIISPIVGFAAIASSKSMFTGIVTGLLFLISAIVMMGFGKMLTTISAIENHTRMMLLINKSD